MKFITNEYYEVKDPRGMYGLVERFKEFKDAYYAGKEMNRREKKNGYKESEWIIVRTTICKTFDDDGSFISENQTMVKMSV